MSADNSENIQLLARVSSTREDVGTQWNPAIGLDRPETSSLYRLMIDDLSVIR